MAGPPTFSTYSWRELVQAAEGPDFFDKSFYPIVYRFPHGREKKDSGPQGGIYNIPAE